MFLAGYQRHGAFYLLPAIGRVNPEVFYDLAIVKRDLTVKSAADVLDHEIEALALRMRGLETPYSLMRPQKNRAILICAAAD